MARILLYAFPKPEQTLTSLSTPHPTASESTPVEDLARRWTLARHAALRSVLGEVGVEEDEATLVRMAAGHAPEAALKAVFDYSRALGLGFRRYYRVDLTLVDLADLLPALGVPCHGKGFVRSETQPAWCSAGSACCAPPDAALCAHWRESIHGLVGGISSGVCYTRIESPGTGGSTCVDLLHVDPQTPLRFGAIAADVQVALDAVTSLIHRINSSAKVEFFGMVDGALHYRLQASRGACGSCADLPSADADLLDLVGLASDARGGLDVGTVLTHSLRRRFPNLRLCNASPRPVLNEP